MYIVILHCHYFLCMIFSKKFSTILHYDEHIIPFYNMAYWYFHVWFQVSPSIPDLIPPLPRQSSDTIIATNPFDDTPGLRPLGPQQLPPNNFPQARPFGPQYRMHNKQGPPHPLPPAGPGGAGKVYPANQPMVFNPSNPNAPPIYPCGICHKEVHDNDQAILCESGCNFWFHRICTGLTEPAYHMLTQEVYAEWVCDKCLMHKNIPLVKMKP